MGIKENNVKGIIGKHIIYTYDNGWQYEVYVKNEKIIDYRIHSGIVGGRWVKDQEMFLAEVGPDVYKISWDEPTGTTVSLTFNLGEKFSHGTAWFPKWIEDDPNKTICFQNDYIDQMNKFRDAGPTYPKLMVDEFSTITFVEDCGPNREDVINCPPSELPEGYAQRTN